MSEETQENSERRKVTTFFKVETLQIILPLLLAMGSAFMMHDRTIATLKLQTDANTQELVEHQTEMNNARTLLTQAVQLKYRVGELEGTVKELETLEAEVEKLVIRLAQRIEYGDVKIREIEQRLRELERMVDKAHK